MDLDGPDRVLDMNMQAKEDQGQSLLPACFRMSPDDLREQARRMRRRCELD